MVMNSTESLFHRLFGIVTLFRSLTLHCELASGLVGLTAQASSPQGKIMQNDAESCCAWNILNNGMTFSVKKI